MVAVKSLETVGRLVADRCQVHFGKQLETLRSELVILLKVGSISEGSGIRLVSGSDGYLLEPTLCGPLRDMHAEQPAILGFDLRPGSGSGKN